MKNLFIVYGSETKLLKNLFNFEKSHFIKIYNKRIPTKQKNVYSTRSFKDFKKIFSMLVDKNNYESIIFIGAAFVSQKNLFLLEEKEKIDEMVEVNIKNYINYTYYILPQMKKIKSGHFIYLSSFRSNHSSRGISLYSASKAFGEKFFEVLGKENGVFGIYSTSIRMGYFEGRMTNIFPPKKIKEFELSIGNRRLGNQKDLISCIRFILQNPYTNGGVIDLSGGISF